MKPVIEFQKTCDADGDDVGDDIWHRAEADFAAAARFSPELKPISGSLLASKCRPSACGSVQSACIGDLSYQLSWHLI